MRADHGGAELLDPAHQLRGLGGRQRRPGLERLLVEVHAAQVEQPAVELEPPVGVTVIVRIPL